MKSPSREWTAMPGRLKDEFTQLSQGQIAAVVTHLEMRTKLPLRRDHVKQGEYALRRQPAPDLGWYRELYRRVGEEWLWFSRLAMDDAALVGITHDQAVEVHALRHRGRDEGILEIDFRRFPDVEPETLADWYRLLDCGYRVPLVGGSGKNSNTRRK